MKFIHVYLLVFTATVLSTLSAKAQGGPPVPPPAEGPSIPAPNDEIIDARTDNEDSTVLPADEPATNMPALSTRTVTPQGQAPRLQSFKFEGADLDTVMTMYCEWTGKIYLKNDSVAASISLKADKLTIPECINVVESILAMNNIAIVPYGEKFIKVVLANSADLTGEGLKINIDPNTEFTGSDTLVTQIIPLRNVEIPEVQNAIQHIMHSYGKIQTLEGSNSLLITDTKSNILRIRELVDFVDQASARIEPRIYEIVYADASDIAASLNEIITMAQSDQKTGSSARGSAARSSPGVIRARGTQPAAAATPARAAISSTEAGSRMIIQGTVKVMADERTNLILIFSQDANFAFFDNIIKVLDVEVEPAITFEVVNLEYADAVELSGTLNDLVGAAQGGRSTTAGSASSSGASSRSATSRNRTTTSSRSTTSRSASAQITPNADPAGSSGAAAVDNLSKLSENTKILADERSNSILLMGRKSDIAAIKNVIASLDIMLEQVVIEAAIFEIGLDDELRHGIDWLYRSLNTDGSPKNVGAWDGNSLITNTVASVVSQSFSYYQDLSGLDSQILINLSKTDEDSRLISTPIIMTTDNTEATLSIGEQRPVVTSTDTTLNSVQQRSNYEYKDIGIQLTVTPRINPQRFVVMEITQKADQLGPIVLIDDNEVPVILNREFEANIAVPDGGTVVLGGMMQTEMKDTVTKIPILGDIPLIGRYLFSSVTKTEDQRELIVLMTPYVMTNMDEMTGQTERLYKGTSLLQEDWGEDNWSESKLRQIPDPDDFEEGQWIYDEPAVSADQEAASTEINSPAPASTRQVTEKEEIEQLLISLDQ